MMARILVAEDDDAMRVFLEKALSRAGHEVSALANGEAAASCAELEEYDLLVTDVMMPGLDGIDLARRIVARSPKLGVIFVTGFANRAFQATDMIAHGARVLAKPFKLTELVAQVDAMTARIRN
jgi:two-component system cell cycle response regulator CpdR